MAEKVFIGDIQLRVLHLAPEPCIARKIRALDSVEYISGDIRAAVGICLDVHKLPFVDACFDFIYCSHVLNMVRDDVVALQELKRTLKVGGTALIQVPLSREVRTNEAKQDWGMQERAAAFGDPHMWRRHGEDVVHRFEQAGFHVERFNFAARYDDITFERLGLIHEDLLICR